MISWELIVAFALGLTLLYLIGWLLLVPMRLMWRLMAGSLLGALALMIINRFGALLNYSLPLNPLSALAVGALGLVGAGVTVLVVRLVKKSRNKRKAI